MRSKKLNIGEGATALGIGDTADPLKHDSPTRVILPNLIALGQTVPATYVHVDTCRSADKNGLHLSLKIIETDTDRSATYDFPLVIHSNYGPISYRFRDKRRFRSKYANFSTLALNA